MAKAGDTLAGYRIERVVGSGGMGSVYLAQGPDLPRHDALKVLSSAYGSNPEFRARFLREADVAAALTHPNIVAIHQRGETAEGELWIAMQYVDGTDADAALRAGTMTAQRAVHIVAEVAKALDYAHLRNVVHRDVKPANFLLSGPGGPSERVLLGDFGIARGLDDIGLTTTGSVLATMAYAAPEMLSGLAFDARADVYSLGCSLFRLLTGATPFPNNGPAAVVLAHLHQPPPRVTDRRPDLPSGLDWVIATAMAKEPAHRFRTAGDLAEAAQNALFEAAPSAARAVLPAAAVGTPHPSDGGPHQPSWPAQSAPAEPPPAPRRRLRWALVGAALIVVVAGVAALTVIGGSDDTAAPPPASAPSAAAPPTAAMTQRPLPATDLATLLPAPVSLGMTSLAVQDLGLLYSSNTLADNAAELDAPECAAAWAPAQATVYGDSGSTGVLVQTLGSGGPPAQQTTVTQAVIAYPDSAGAENAVATQMAQWGRCANRTVTVTAPGTAAQRVTFADPRGSSGTTRTLDQTRDSLPALRCQRSLASSNNVVVDVVACSPTVQDPGRTVAAVLSGRVPVS